MKQSVLPAAHYVKKESIACGLLGMVTCVQIEQHTPGVFVNSVKWYHLNYNSVPCVHVSNIECQIILSSESDGTR